MTPQDVARLGQLARIELTEEELNTLAPQLDVILDAVAAVSEVAGPDVPPSSHAIAMTNVFREDVVTESMPTAKVLQNAPMVEMDRFRVPRILEED